MTAPTDGDYRAEIEAALGSGWLARSLYATDRGQTVRVLLTGPGGRTRLVSVAVPAAGAAPSIVDLAPAMGWDEREAHDLYSVGFSGHEPLRPLVDHSAPLEAWTVPVHGHDPYQVAVGPIHAGIIESGHFRFHVVGDRILHLDAQLFYKHRGLERAAEGMTLPSALAVISRACAACSVANGVAYATATEQLLGLRSYPRTGPGPDLVARDGTGLEPSQRHRRHLRRGRHGSRDRLLSCPHRDGPPPERRRRRASLPGRQRPCRRQPPGLRQRPR